MFLKYKVISAKFSLFFIKQETESLTQCFKSVLTQSLYSDYPLKLAYLLSRKWETRRSIVSCEQWLIYFYLGKKLTLEQMWLIADWFIRNQTWNFFFFFFFFFWKKRFCRSHQWEENMIINNYSSVLFYIFPSNKRACDTVCLSSSQFECLPLKKSPSPFFWPAWVSSRKHNHMVYYVTATTNNATDPRLPSAGVSRNYFWHVSIVTSCHVCATDKYKYI